MVGQRSRFGLRGRDRARSSPTRVRGGWPRLAETRKRLRDRLEDVELAELVRQRKGERRGKARLDEL
jgi:hypothetical protein